MRLLETLVVATITVSVAGASYAKLDSARLTDRAKEVAARVSCRAIDAAIVAYADTHARSPVSIRDLTDYIKGDISAYRIVDGKAAGPDC